MTSIEEYPRDVWCVILDTQRELELDRGEPVSTEEAFEVACQKGYLYQTSTGKVEVDANNPLWGIAPSSELEA